MVLLGGLLTTLMMVSSTMQFSLGALGPHLMAEFKLSNSQLGLLNLCYYAMVAVFSIATPRLLRRLSDRAAALCMVLLTAAGLVIVARSPETWVILLGLCLASVATAAGNPTTNRATLHTGDARTTLIAFKQSGVALSTVVCGAVLPSLAAAIGWRDALLSFSLTCLLPIPFLRWVSASTASTPPTNQVAPLRYSTHQLSLYAFLMGCGSATVSAYLVLFGFHRLRAGETSAGLLLSCVGLGAIVGRFLWGALAIRSTKRGRHLQGYLVAMGLVATLSALGLAASSSVGMALALPCALLMGLSASSWNPLAMMIATSSGESRETVSMSGQVMFGFFSGLAVAPPLFGTIVDGFGYVHGWMSTGAVFAIATVIIMKRRADAPAVPTPRGDESHSAEGHSSDSCHTPSQQGRS
jgi:cyanate permease